MSKNKVEDKLYYEINKFKGYFLKINEIDKPLVRLISKKIEKTKISGKKKP